MADNRPQLNQTETAEVEIDLLDLLSSFRQHIVIIALLAVAGAVLGFCITRFAIKPLYKATSSIYAVSATANSVLDLTDLNLGTTLTKDYVELVQSRTLLENVIADAGDDLTVKQLRDMLDVGNTANTRILTFTITSPDPEQAMRLANAFNRQAILFLPEVMGVKDNVPTTIDLAILPTTPSNIKTARNTAIGLLAGLVLAIAIFTVQYMLNDTFNSAEDVEKYLNIVPLAMVPENGQKHKSGGYYYYTNAGKRGSAR